jgi:hypothetical protein
MVVKVRRITAKRSWQKRWRQSCGEVCSIPVPEIFYDVYIIMKTQHPAINKELFGTALNATSQKRGALLALQDKEIILQTIRSDAIMR